MSEVHETQKKNNNGAFIAVIVVLLLVLGILGYKWSAANSQLDACAKEKQALSDDMAGMNSMMSGYSDNMTNDLKADFQNMLSTYDKLKAKDASQADSINLQKEKIQTLLNQLNSNKKFSAQQLYNMRKENETLRNIMKGYVKQIDSLNTLNLQLNTDLDTRTSQLNEASTQRDQYRSEAEVAGEK